MPDINDFQVTEKQCCNDTDYRYIQNTIENDGFDNFYTIEHSECIHCGHYQTIAKIIVEDTGI